MIRLYQAGYRLDMRKLSSLFVRQVYVLKETRFGFDKLIWFI